MSDGAEYNLDSYFQRILSHLAVVPDDCEAVMTDLHSLINKCDAEIIEGRRARLPLINPEFRPQIKSAREKVDELFGRHLSISELRTKADLLSGDCSIPLPNSTRKNSDALMQWFHVNWSLIEPSVLKSKESGQAQNSV